MIAETSEDLPASGVSQRLALVARSEVPYTETHGWQDLRRLTEPSDGHLDEAHTLRDATGADVVHLIVGESDDAFYNVCGIANRPGPLGRAAPRWTDTATVAGATPIRAVQLTELRVAVLVGMRRLG